ncbi:MAG: hypothetical protein IRZ09_12570 [Variibacter sp.]|nr:hypothetical protein [Variibacter sp.]
MNWTDLVGPLVRLGAPVLGQALGGPLGAAAGKIVAEAFGAREPTPAAVEAAIGEADPAAAAQAARVAEERWLAALAEVGRAQVAEVAGTMRAEAASGDALQRWWRPLYALELSLLECPAFALTLLHALWRGHEAGINGFATLSGLLIAYFGARFGVLGVYVSGRTREKQAAVTGALAPSLVGEIAKAVRGRK